MPGTPAQVRASLLSQVFGCVLVLCATHKAGDLLQRRLQRLHGSASSSSFTPPLQTLLQNFGE